jgi:uncharacterized protein
MRSPDLTADEKAASAAPQTRFGHLHLRQRLGLEQDHEARVLRLETAIPCTR